MLVLTNLVVPVDFESTSYHALAYARELALAFGARLHLVHVLDDTFALRAGTEGSLSSVPELARRAEREAQERLEALLTEAERKLGAVPFVVISPSPATAIVAYAERVHASAIVMGTNGRLEVTDAIGSVAEHVVRTAPCPVLTLRRPPQEAALQAPAAAEVRRGTP
jgi:nucleotide-binding universal stress UspA family protein